MNRKERYIPIEKIEQGTWVRTYNNEFKRVKYILNSKSIGVEKHSMSNLYCMRREKSPDLLCDLYVTGGHAILYDSLTKKQQRKMNIIIEYCKKHDSSSDLCYNFNKPFMCYHESGF